MKTKTAIKHAGSQKKLAEVFGVTESAISQWGENIPEGRYWQLRVIRPSWFSTAKSKANSLKRKVQLNTCA